MGQRFQALNSLGLTIEEKGAVDSGDVPTEGALAAIDGTTKKLDISLMPSGLGVETITAIASEALTAGDLVNIFDNSGSAGVRKADRSNGRKADGFVKANVANAGSATIFVDNGTIITGLSALTIGATYFLGTAGAAVTTLPAAASGHLLQRIGKATSATSLIFEKHEEITRVS
ncbi:MAG: hypothetical protein ACRC62_15735 [Microcoleus sp.]